MKKLKTKFAIIVSLLCLVCLLLSNSISYYISYSIVMEQSKQKTIATAHNYAEKLDGWLKTQGKVLEEIVSDLQYYNNYEKDKVIGYLKSKIENNPDVITYYIGFNNKDFYTHDNWIPPAGWDCTSRPWYQDAVKAGKLIYTSPYIDANTGDMIISIAKPVKSNNSTIGVVGADIKVTVLTDMVQAAKLDIGINTQSKSYAFLLDESNNFLSHPYTEFAPSKEREENDRIRNISTVMNNRFSEFAELIKGNKLAEKEMKDYDNITKYFVLAPVKSTGWNFVFAIPSYEFKEPLNGMIIGTVLALAASLVLAIVVTLLWVNRFINPILKVKHHMNLVANGDLTGSVNVKSKDEIGQLGDSFNKMVSDLKNIISNIYETYKAAKEKSENVIQNTSNVKVISGEISGATQQIAVEAMDLKSNINTGREYLDSFTNKIDDISNKINEINGNSDTAIQSVEKGLDKLGELHIIEDEVNNQSTRTYAIIDAFNQSTSGINNMTGVISNIADQTNMLALNAAIEAARAGEMGKGFAVVAEQVRKLADESSKAAKEIESLVKTVKSEVENFEIVKEKGIELDEKKKRINGDMSEYFNNIQQNIKEIVEKIKNVYSQMSEIEIQKTNMNEIMKNISDISENSAAATEQVCAATENQENLLYQAVEDIKDLTAKVDQLSNTVKKFNI